MTEPQKLSLAYAAGFIDGDGSILVSRYGRAHGVSVYATNTARPLLERFEHSFGGSLRLPIVDKRNRSWKPTQMWIKSINKSGGFLRDLEPLLFVKRKQAQLGLELVARKKIDRRTFRGWRYGSGAAPQEEYDARDVIAAEIARLNSLPCSCPHEGVPSLDYLAGLFDAEGCVGVYKYKKTAHRIQVNVSIRCQWILEHYERLFGGSVSKGNMCWQWQCQCRIAQRFLQQITPHLVLKRERAINALSLYDSVGINNGWHFRNEGRLDVAATKTISDDYNRKGVIQ